MKKLGCLIFFSLIISQGVNAEAKDPNELLRAKWETPIKDANNPNEVLQVKWNAVIKVLRSEDIDPNTKADIIDKIVCPIFNFEVMSKLSLGKANWSKLTPAQSKEFSRLFMLLLKKTYREKILLYKDEKGIVGSAIQKGKTVHIPMEIISSGKKITILYKLHRPEKKWLIYDVEIQGVSIILTYRSQFTDILSHGTFEDVIANLKKPVTQ